MSTSTLQRDATLVNVIEQRPSKWILPAWWRRWESYRFEMVDHRSVIVLEGDWPPIQLTERTFNEFLLWLETDFDPETGGYMDRAERLGDAVLRFGPLSPITPNDGHPVWVGRAERASVPDVPGVIDVESTLDELRVLRIGCRLAFAIADGDERAIENQLRDFDRRSRSIDTRWEMVYPELGLFASRADEDARQFNAPEGLTGVGLQLLGWMAGRWPVRIFTAAQFGYRPIPLPQSPVHIVWLSLAHSVGALDLPFGPRVRYCAYCRKPIFSTRQRKSGSRWFCDPPEGARRSTCQNRFFVEQSRKSKSNPNKEDSK